MALFYKLDENNFKGNKSEIGNIMLEFSQRLLREHGLSLNQLAISSLEQYCEILHGINSSELEVVTEEILWKNMSGSEKALKLSGYLTDQKESITELLIIDSYLFAKNSRNEYIHCLEKHSK